MTAQQVYRIKNWKGHFEMSQNGNCKTMSWIAVPVKHDGKSYRRLMALANGPQLYAAWILIAAVAAKCEPRGTLLDDGVPLTAEDLHFKTGASEELFAEALVTLASHRIGWLEQVDTNQLQDETPLTPTSQTDASTLAALERTAPPLLLQDKTGQDKTPEPVAGVFENPGSRRAGKRKPDQEPSVFTGITEADLRDDAILLRWYDFACKRPSPVFDASEVTLLKVFGAAEHALRAKRVSNRVAIFAAICSKGNGPEGWQVITQTEEDAARKRLQASEVLKRPA